MFKLSLECDDLSLLSMESATLYESILFGELIC